MKKSVWIPGAMRSSLFLVCSCWLLVGCLSTQQIPGVSVEVITHRAAETMRQHASFHFVVEVEGSLTYLDPQRVLAFKRAEGDVALPDRVRAVVRTRTMGTTNELTVTGIGNKQWARNPISGKWETLPPEYGAFAISGMFDDRTGIASLLQTTDFTSQSNEHIGGRSQYVLAGVTTGERLASMTAGMIAAGTIDVHLWIDQETFGLTQVELVERNSDPQRPTQWRIALSAFGKPVTITAPIEQ